jgi:hypothetical protein
MNFRCLLPALALLLASCTHAPLAGTADGREPDEYEADDVL